MCLFTRSFAASANASPNITVDVVFNVTAGKVNTLTMTTIDPDGDTVNVTLTSTLPNGATFENNVYTWTPNSMEPANISYVDKTETYFEQTLVHVDLDIRENSLKKVNRA